MERTQSSVLQVVAKGQQIESLFLKAKSNLMHKHGMDQIGTPSTMRAGTPVWLPLPQPVGHVLLLLQSPRPSSPLPFGRKKGRLLAMRREKQTLLPHVSAL